jgi:hypothetical protein
MQTLNRDSDLDEPAIVSTDRKRHRFGLVAAIAAVVLVAAGVAYAVGTTQSTTKTTVKTVNVTPSSAPAANCIPGVAAGSCNTDEAAEAQIPDKPLDATTRAALQLQLIAARNAAMQYPTVGAAKAAGFIPAGSFSPKTGAHYISITNTLNPNFDAAHPGSLIYDGDNATSKVIGVMYLASGINPPEGFAGPNDHWHRHSNTCVIFGGPGGITVPFPADASVTKAQCDAKHGTFMRRTNWMVHAWVVPGWESRGGVFAHDNDNVVCKDGTLHVDATGFCEGT